VRGFVHLEVLIETQILLPRWIIPVEPARVTLVEHALVIEESRIAALLPMTEARIRYPTAAEVSLPEHVLIPGLVNLHCHAAMVLMRGLSDDTPLMTWLNDHIWPAEAKHVDAEFVHDGTLLAMAEMLSAGITTVNDMYWYPSSGGRAALRAGMRAALSINIIEFPSRYAANVDEYFAKGLAARSEFAGEPLLGFTLGPHAPYTISDATFRRVVTLAEELDVPIHTHLHETQAEIEGSLKEHRVRPLERLANLGVVSPRLISVHSVHMDASEIDYCARNGVHVAHCPTSNLKLASGIAPIAAMQKAGINVGIGTDGAASNNRLDMMAETRLATLLAKCTAGDPTVMAAHEAIAAATINGARALGWADRIGSLLPGKDADLTAVRLDDLSVQPLYQPASHLINAAGRAQVSDVWIRGRRVVESHQVLTVDRQEVLAKARYWQARLAG
jgi:5-methylthioadenosine/S-adenosylhomocysteine deaminase